MTHIPFDATYIRDAIRVSREEKRIVYVAKTNKGEKVILKEGARAPGLKIVGFADGFDWFPFKE